MEVISLLSKKFQEIYIAYEKNAKSNSEINYTSNEWSIISVNFFFNFLEKERKR